MGYTYATQVRMVPMNGLEETLTFADAFSDCNGATRHRVVYDDEIDDRENINLAAVSYVMGFRPIVEFEVIITSIADHENLAKIVNRIASSEWAVYLSLDGGMTERQVELVTPPSPLPIGGKTIAGARYVTRVRCVELLDELPVMNAAGGW